MQQRYLRSIVYAVVFLFIGILLVACGGSNKTVSQSLASNATVNVSFSDPPTCGADTGGAYGHVYVTVKDVMMSTNQNAGDNDSSWVDLTPNLKNAPQQVDLLATPHNGCFLAQLGTAGIPAGTYQQIRLILADNSVAPANGNSCKNGTVNCVVLATDPTNPRALQLSSEAKTGIKIPPGQIAGGSFTVANGETKDLNIDFDACASLVAMGNGGFRLKPVLHAGEVSTIGSTAIVGRVVSQTGVPIVGDVIVALERKDESGVDRMVLQTTPSADGTFSFCPVTNGTYDVVVVAIGSANNVLTAYGPTLVAGITPGTTIGNITLNASSSTTTGSTAPASLTAKPLINNNSGVAVDYTVSALQSVTIGSATTATPVTVPLAQQQSATATFTTANNSDCATNTWCADGTLVVPANNITVAVLNNGVLTYTPASTGTVSYKVDARPPLGSTCTPAVQTSDAATVTPGSTDVKVTPVLSFTGCQ